jgi:CheY-like chemotaxis protein/DNA-directed RNA polymerase subunit RPC12/RpoP
MTHSAVDIVVADDNAALLGVLSEILEECGYSVRTALDGLEALTEIRRRVPDILLSDLNMPRMTGFELLSIVRRRYPMIKVIAMSASYSAGIVPQAVAADEFYDKGAASIVKLLLIVDAMKNEQESRLLRILTPVWIARPSIESSEEVNTTFACPECLRAYPCAIREAETVRNRECPYCLFRVQLTVFPGIRETATPLSSTTTIPDQVRNIGHRPNNKGEDPCRIIIPVPTLGFPMGMPVSTSPICTPFPSPTVRASRSS